MEKIWARVKKRMFNISVPTGFYKNREWKPFTKISMMRTKNNKPLQIKKHDTSFCMFVFTHQTFNTYSK